MSKCRGCGNDTSSGPSIDVPGLGWMHDICEIKRLNGLYEEAQGFEEQFQAEVERLRSALNIAAGLISTKKEYATMHPEEVKDLLVAWICSPTSPSDGEEE